jgi:hypothetical protein
MKNENTLIVHSHLFLHSQQVCMQSGQGWQGMGFWVWVFQKPNKTHHGFNGFEIVGWHCSTVNYQKYYGTNGEISSYQVILT